MSTTIRVSNELKQRIDSLSATTGRRLQDVIARGIAEYEKVVFWERFNTEVEELRADRKAWAEELAERALWEGTLRDGLDDEPAE